MLSKGACTGVCDPLKPRHEMDAEAIRLSKGGEMDGQEVNRHENERGANKSYSLMVGESSFENKPALYLDGHPPATKV